MSRPARPAPPLPRKRRNWIVAIAISVVALAAAGIVVVMLINRVETGRWEVPDGADFVRIIKQQQRDPSRTIFLERKPIVIAPGIDDAPRAISSVVAGSRKISATMPGWKGSDAGWKQTVACVKKLFEPFAVVVTDQRPQHEDYVLVAVGGKPSDLGRKEKRVSGLAPFNGEVIPRAVVFSFSAALGNDVRATCETIGMEVAHAYGLDHGYDCRDVMTYLNPCGPKRFLDKDIPCGEAKKRACEGGEPTQNSYRHLLGTLGPRPRS